MDQPSECSRITASFRVFRVRDEMPGLIASSLEGRRWSRSRNALHMFMMGASAIPDVTHLGHLTPTHRGEFHVQVHNELVDLWREGLASFSRSTLLPGGEQALHAEFFKLIRFPSQRAPGDIDFFGSLPCGFVEQNQGSDRFIQFLLWSQRPLF